MQEGIAVTLVPKPGKDMSIIDPDVLLLASIASTLASDYVNPKEDPWAGSPFAWIRTRPSRQVGKIGEQLVAGWAAAKGLDVVSAGDSQADRVINGKRAEIKFSTLWAGGDYVFQQIRNQNYELAILLGLSPHEASCWVVPKIVMFGGPLAGLTGQHTGASAADTKWLRFRPAAAPDWLRPYGGKLSEAFELLRRR